MPVLSYFSLSLQPHQELVHIEKSTSRVASLALLSSVKLAGDTDGENPVLSQGVVTVHHWGKNAPPPEQKPSSAKGGGGIIAAVSHAIGATSAAASSTGGGDADSATGAPYIPGPAAALFFEAMRKHREWNRDVSKVPA